MSTLHQQPVYGPPVPARPVFKAPLVIALIGLVTVIVGVAVGGAVS